MAKIQRLKALGGVRPTNWGYEKGVLEGVSRTIMANRNDASVVCKVERIGGAVSTPTQAPISKEEYLKE